MDLPTQFGRYSLIEKIATGGMAEIFKAKLIGVEGFEKDVVIKRILPFWSERRDFITMLVDEAKVLVHLNHPNIVQVYELGRVGATYFIAMEYVDGFDLRQLIHKLNSSGEFLPLEIALSITIEVLRGLQYAHERSLPNKGFLGIVHRDISPQNILLSLEGEVKVTDFGIAKAVTQTHETQTGVLKGKYAYMSPEQAVGRPLDARSDLFSCAAVFYELLFGERAFPGKNDMGILESVRNVAIRWPQDQLSRLYPRLQEVLERALSKDPKERFQTAEEFRVALEGSLPEGKKIDSSVRAHFLKVQFANEIHRGQRREQVVTEQTKEEGRKTLVADPADQETVSIVETMTEREEIPFQEETPSVAPPQPSRKIKYLPTIMVSLWLLLAIGVTAYFLKFWKGPVAGKTPAENAASNPLEGEKLSADEPFNVAAMPKFPPSTPTPSPTPSGSLTLKVVPNPGKLFATYPGGKKSGKGELVIPGLFKGNEVRVTAELKGYESKTKVFKISPQVWDEAQVITLKKKIPKFGTIAVNAFPWGRVVMAGYIGGKETPVSRGKIPEGSYRVRVSYPPLNKSVSAVAVIRGGRTTKCHADFEGKARLRCR